MKVIIVLCALASCTMAGVVAPVAPVAIASLDTGVSTNHRSQDHVGNYVFGYDIAHATGGNFRKEVGDIYGNKVGSYGLTDIDGRIRIVNYVADANGFRVDIKSNEPGVGIEDPAASTINKDLVVAPAGQYASYIAAPSPLFAQRFAAAHHALYAPHLGNYGVRV